MTNDSPYGQDRSTMDWIDEEGYRANVGIILTDGSGRVLIGGRVGRSGWQFPQGGIAPDESTEQAMFRELNEEIGFEPDDVETLGRTRDWLRYRLPEQFVRRGKQPICIGQKQCWYLLRLISDPPSGCDSIRRRRRSSIDAVGWIIGVRSRKSSTSSGRCTCRH